MSILSKLKSVKHELKQQFGIEEFAIFGSYARGEETQNSDVDIAIIKMKEKDYFKRVEAKYFLEKVLKKSVDIGYLDTMRSLIKKEVKKDLVYV